MKTKIKFDANKGKLYLPWKIGPMNLSWNKEWIYFVSNVTNILIIIKDSDEISDLKRFLKKAI